IVVALEPIAEVAPSLARYRHALAQILPSAKAAARAGDQQGADSIVVGRAFERGREGLVERRRKGVQALGPVEGQGRDTVIDRNQERRLCHAAAGALLVPLSAVTLGAGSGSCQRSGARTFRSGSPRL